MRDSNTPSSSTPSTVPSTPSTVPSTPSSSVPSTPSSTASDTPPPAPSTESDDSQCWDTTDPTNEFFLMSTKCRDNNVFTFCGCNGEASLPSSVCPGSKPFFTSGVSCPAFACEKGTLKRFVKAAKPATEECCPTYECVPDPSAPQVQEKPQADQQEKPQEVPQEDVQKGAEEVSGEKEDEAQEVQEETQDDDVQADAQMDTQADPVPGEFATVSPVAITFLVLSVILAVSLVVVVVLFTKTVSQTARA